jgi:hypothetical protein
MASVRRVFPLFVVLFPALCSLAQNPSQAAAPASAQQTSNRRHSLGLPLAFEANRGQAAVGVDFVARGQGYSAQLRANRVTLSLNRASYAAGERKTAADDVVEITLAGANRSARVAGEDKSPGHSNYLFGSNPADWIVNVEQYAKVRYANVYPGIDLVFHGSQSRLEHDFIVHPGATAAQIGLMFPSILRTELQNDGDLVLQVQSGEWHLQRPRAYQVVGSRETEVPVRYVLHEGRASFRLGRYDRRRILVIDPVLVYSTFFGGGAAPNGVIQAINAMAVDTSGNLYVAGSTDSTSFPVTPGVVQPTPSPVNGTFVSKLDPTGTSLIFSTYMTGFYGIAGLAVDTSGNVHIAGVGASGLPIPPGSTPFQGSEKSEQNLAVLKLNNTGTAVLDATYLGGSGNDNFGGLAIDSAGDVYVTGWTSSNDFPVKNPLQGALGTSGYNAFVTELNPTLSALVYSTYLGANSLVIVPGTGSIALDSSDDAYVIGTASPGFPTVAGAYQATCPNTCAYLAKLNPSGSSILYSTYLSSDPDAPYAVAVDSSENAFLAGFTFTASFPVVHPIQSCGAINGSNGNPGNFLAEFNAAGALTFSTCLGISPALPGGVPAPVLALDASGNVYLAGASEPGLPLQNPIDDNPPAVERPFVSEIDPNTNSLLFSGYVAGPLSYDDDDYATGDTIAAITVDASGNLYLGGSSTVGSPGQYSYLPVFNPLQSYFVNNNTYCLPTTYCTYTDGFIIKISLAAGAAAALVPAELQFPPVAVGATSSPQTTTIYDLGTDGLTVSNAAISGDFAIQSNNCASVPASGGSCAIAVTFTPTAMGARNGTLTITDSSAGSPHTVALAGQGSSNNPTVSPSNVSFPSQLVGTSSSTQTVTLTAGVVAVGSLHLQTSGAFSETNNCGTGLAALGTCQVLVSFTPTSSGSQSGTLTMTDSAPNSPQTVSLSGTGTSPGLALGIAPGGSSSATVAAGSTAKYSLSIGGAGISGTAALSCAGAPTGATCVVPATEAVSATTAADFNVSVTTTSSTTAALRQRDFRRLPWLWALALMGGVMLPGKARTKRSPPWRLLWLPLFLLTFICSCGGGSKGSGGGNSGGTPAGNYTLTVTAAVGSTSQPMSLTLTVQ